MKKIKFKEEAIKEDGNIHPLKVGSGFCEREVGRFTGSMWLWLYYKEHLELAIEENMLITETFSVGLRRH